MTNTTTLTVPSILTTADIATDLESARMALSAASLAVVEQARLTAQELHTTAQHLDWDNPADVAALTASRDASRAYQVLAYAHGQVWGNGGYPAVARPAWLPVPQPATPSTSYEPTVLDESDIEDRL